MLSMHASTTEVLTILELGLIIINYGLVGGGIRPLCIMKIPPDRQEKRIFEETDEGRNED